MAVAFTREEDYESQAADLPDRPVSANPNLVTASGLAAIEAELAGARAAYAAAQAAALLEPLEDAATTGTYRRDLVRALTLRAFEQTSA